MFPRTYTVPFEAIGVTATQDFFELTAASGKPIWIYGIDIGQTSDVGDAQDEILRYQIIRGHSTSGSGGGTVTPKPLDHGTQAAGFTAELNNTTPASAGSPVTVLTREFNVRAGEQLWLPQGSWISCPAGGIIVARLAGAPADSLTMSGELYVAEVG